MKFYASVLAILVLSFAAFGQVEEKLCEVKTKKDVTKRCQNKLVKMTGLISKIVMQHPIMVMPAGLSETKKTFQNYIDTKFGQIVLLSKEEITCTENIEITGKLKMKSFGGESGKKTSYKNPFIEIVKFACQ